MRIFKQYKYDNNNAGDFSNNKTPYIQQGTQFFGNAFPPTAIELVDSTKDKYSGSLEENIYHSTLGPHEIKNPWWAEKRESDYYSITDNSDSLSESSFSIRKILEGENLEETLPTLSSSNKTIIVDSLEEI